MKPPCAPARHICKIGHLTDMRARFELGTAEIFTDKSPAGASVRNSTNKKAHQCEQHGRRSEHRRGGTGDDGQPPRAYRMLCHGCSNPGRSICLAGSARRQRCRTPPLISDGMQHASSQSMISRRTWTAAASRRRAGCRQKCVVGTCVFPEDQDDSRHAAVRARSAALGRQI